MVRNFGCFFNVFVDIFCFTSAWLRSVLMYNPCYLDNHPDQNDKKKTSDRDRMYTNLSGIINGKIIFAVSPMNNFDKFGII